MSTDQHHARVAFVGAGPGDPGLLTMRAARLIENADAVIFDQICGERFVAPFVRDEVELVDAGYGDAGAQLTTASRAKLVVKTAKSVAAQHDDADSSARGGEQPLRGVQHAQQFGGTGQREHRGPTLRPGHHQAAVPQARQVLAYRRLSKVHVVDQVTDPMLPTGEVFQERQARGLGQGMEQSSAGVGHLHRSRAFILAIDRHRAMLPPWSDSLAPIPWLAHGSVVDVWSLNAE